MGAQKTHPMFDEGLATIDNYLDVEYEWRQHSNRYKVYLGSLYTFVYL